MIQESLLLTKRELEVIDKKLKSQNLSQQDSNYLSKLVRPKLREMNSIDSRSLLKRLEYNQKSKSIDKKIIHMILSNIRDVTSISLYGSVVYNNYHDYNDLDILVTVKKKFWDKSSQKYAKIVELKREARKHHLDIDLEIYEEEVLYQSYPSNISLVYQLKDSRMIYGLLKLPSNISIPKLELRMKLDYSIVGKESTGLEIYRAIRNLWLINLTMDRLVDNIRLNQVMEEELGKNIISRLKSDKYSKTDKEIVSLYLDNLLKTTLRKINQSRWEKLAL